MDIKNLQCTLPVIRLVLLHVTTPIHVTEVDVREVKLGRLSSLEFPFLEQDH